MINMKALNKGIKWIIIPVLAIAALGVVFLFFLRSQEITIREDMYQYFSGVRFDYKETTVISRENDETVLKNNSVDTPLDSTPLYYAKKDRVFLPAAMTYVDPAGTRLARLDFFTEVYTGGGMVHAQRGRKSIDIPGGFAFDGKDAYLFLEPMTVVVKNEEIRLKPLSYAIVSYNREVNLYRFGEGKFDSMPFPATGFTAKSDSGYVINLNTDILVRKDGTEQLIFNKPDLLKPMEAVMNGQ